MNYRKVGKWGVKVSELGFGTYLNVGHKIDEETSKELIRTAYESGVNFFDTADAYNNGQAEEMLGKCVKDYRRESLFILTKLFWDMGSSPNDSGLSAKHIHEGCAASLKRLGMDYLDVLMCHRPDPNTPIEETIWAMEDLIRQGKILYWGVSEWSPIQIIRAQQVVKELGARPIAINEPRYSLLYRQPEKELFSVTKEEGIGNVVFSPLANGLLTGKYLPGANPPSDSRAADSQINGFMMNTFYSEENKIKGQELIKLASELGVTAPQLAIAWCLKRKEVSSVILGATRVNQLKETLKASEVQIPDDLAAKLDKLYPMS